MEQIKKSTAKERVEKEFSELKEKLEGLTNFLESDRINSISEIQKELLTIQKDIMKAYLNVLISRLSNWEA